jgi:hypothetical protein
MKPPNILSVNRASVSRLGTQLATMSASPSALRSVLNRASRSSWRGHGKSCFRSAANAGRHRDVRVHWLASNQLRVVVQRFCSVLLPKTAHFGLAGHRTGSCDCRHDPATIAQDWPMVTVSTRLSLHTAHFGLSRSARLRITISCSVRIGVRRGLDLLPQHQHFRWVPPTAQLGEAYSQSMENTAPTASQPTGKSNPMTNSAIQGFIQALDEFVNTPRSNVVC